MAKLCVDPLLLKFDSALALDKEAVDLVKSRAISFNVLNG